MLYRRIEANRNVSLRPFNQVFDANSVDGNELFYDLLLAGKLAIFELDFLANYQLFRGCRKRAKMRWHSANAKLAETRLVFGLRKTLDARIKWKINKMQVTKREVKTDYLNCFASRLRHTFELGIFNQWFAEKRRPFATTPDEMQCIYGHFFTNQIHSIVLENMKITLILMITIFGSTAVVLISETLSFNNLKQVQH